MAERSEHHMRAAEGVQGDTLPAGRRRAKRSAGDPTRLQPTGETDRGRRS
jgi:hypothetical protein